jgi:peroxiredoxin
MDTPYLKPGSLAPAFTLPSNDGQPITRSQYRNKAGLLLIFVPSLADPSVAALLEQVAKDTERYSKLRAKVYIISHTPGNAPLPVLTDADGTTWRAYSGQSAPGYGVFVLDKYGGVDTQIVGADPAILPDAETLYELMQSTMYKCNI